MYRLLSFLVLVVILFSPFVSALAINPFLNISTLGCSLLGFGYLLILSRLKMDVSKGLYLFLFIIYFSAITLINDKGEKTVNQYIMWTFSFLVYYFFFRNTTFLLLRKNEISFKLILDALIITVACSSVFALIEFVMINFLAIDINAFIPRGTVPEYTPLALIYTRARSFMEESGQFALFLECLAPLSIVYCGCRYNKITLFIFIFVVILSLLTSFSAYGFVSLLVCVVVYVYYFIKQSQSSILLIFKLSGLLLLLFVLLYCTGLSELLYQVVSVKMDSSSSLNDRQGRIEDLPSYLNGIHFFIGYGAGSYSSLKIDSLVSLFAGIILNTGICGTILYCGFLLTQFFMILKIKDIKCRMAFVMSFTTATAHYLFVDNIYVSWYWIMLSLAYCIYKLDVKLIDV